MVRVAAVTLCDLKDNLTLAFTMDDVDVWTFRRDVTVRPDKPLDRTIFSHL